MFTPFHSANACANIQGEGWVEEYLKNVKKPLITVTKKEITEVFNNMKPVE